MPKYIDRDKLIEELKKLKDGWNAEFDRMIEEAINLCAAADADNVIEKPWSVEDDEIFLLSVEEYEKYKDVIPVIKWWWWLRSPGYSQDGAALVNYVGSVFSYGGDVRADDAVRPALRIGNPASSNLKIGGRFVKYEFPWIYLGDGLAIADVPIGFRRFDKESNDYQRSEVRKWLFEWKSERK